ncbi:MAG: hypothetical protein WBO92_02550 [Candidatus Moraniibacteriota bacterium]
MHDIPFPHYKNFSPGVNFFILVGALFINYISVWFLSTSPGLATIPIALTCFSLILYARSWKLALVAGVFAVAGAGQEAFFIANGLWSYETVSFLSIPLYLPFTWANISILVVGIFQGLLRLKTTLHLYHKPPAFSQALWMTGVAALAVLLAIHHWAEVPLRLVLFFLFIDFAYIAVMRSVPLAMVGLIAMAAGSIADLVAVPLGLWSYPAGGHFSGIPGYIFLGWDIVGLFAAGLYLTIDLLSQERNPLPSSQSLPSSP